MRITAINIDGFGIFHETAITDLPPGLALFLGHNEAGKSTLLAYIRQILFGFPRINSADQQYLPVSGGNLGGRLTLIGRTGNTYVVERKTGKGGGNVIVTGDDGKTYGKDFLPQLLGGATPELFKNIYGFSLTELQTMESLQARSVKSVIYGASAGIGMFALPKAENVLQRKKEQLFKPRGSKGLINTKLGELENIAVSLRQAKRDMAQYDQIVMELDSKNQEITVLQKSQQSLQQELNRTASLINLWPDWLLHLETAGFLQELPDIAEFPENGLSELDGLCEKRRGLEDRRSEIDSELAQLEERVSEFPVNPSLLSCQENISHLWQGRKEYLNFCTLRPLKEQQLAHTVLDTDRLITVIGPGWTRDRVVAVDRSLINKEKIRRFEREAAGRRNELASAQRILQDRQEQVRLAESETEKAADFLSGLDADIPEYEETLISKLQQGRDECGSIIRDLGLRRSELILEEDHLRQNIAEINPAWTVESIKNFDISFSIRKHIEDFETRFRQQETACQESQTRLTAQQANRKKLQGRLKDLTDQLPKNEFGTSDENGKNILAAKRTFRLLRGEVLKYLQVVQQKDAITAAIERENVVQRQAADMRTCTLRNKRYVLAAGFIAMLVAVPLTIHYFPGGGWLPVAGGILGAGLLTTGILRRKSLAAGRCIAASDERSGNLSVQSLEYEKSLQESVLELECLMDILKDSSSIESSVKHQDILDLQALDRIEERLELQFLAFQEIQQIQLAAKQLRIELAEADAELSGLETEAAERHAEFMQVQFEWHKLLKKFALEGDLTPLMVQGVIGRVEMARQQAKTFSTLEKRIAQMETAREHYVELCRRIPPLAPHCDADGMDFVKHLDGFLAGLAIHRKKLEEYQQAQKNLQEKSRFLKEMNQAAVLAAEQLALQESRLLINQEQWRDYLEEQGLPQDISEDTCLELLNLLNEISEQLLLQKQLAAEVTELIVNIEKYELAVNNLLSGLGMPRVASGRIAVAIEELFNLLQKDLGNQQTGKEIAQQKRNLKGQLQIVREKIVAGDQKIAELLEQGNARDVNEFRKRGDLFSKRRQLAVENRQAVSNMQRLSGEPDFAQLSARLRQATLGDLQARHTELGGGLEELTDELENARNRRAQLKQLHESLSGADDIVRLRIQEESLLTELTVLGNDWLRCQMALYLIHSAREKFEKDQQPKVVKDAARFFSRITDSRYRGLIAPIGEESIEVIDVQNKRKSADTLSRGTAEQLYLAIRFGYIRSRSVKNEALPIIMDDILVNFDPDRARRAAEAVLELAADHQILFFTCHPYTIEIFRKLNDSLPLYQLHNGTLS